MEESIYALIPREPEKVVKPQRHKSKYPGTLAPTASTFGATLTSQGVATNVAGSWEIKPCRDYKRAAATFGPKNGKVSKTKPGKFLKKNTQENMPEPKKFTRKTANPKPKVPSTSEKPVMGLFSNKNFIKANAISAILQEPKQTVPMTSAEMIKHAEYGAVPEYLQTVKQEIADEYAYIKHMEGSNEPGGPAAANVRLLPEEDKEALLSQLKDKWELINHEYQSITHLVKLDTIGKIRRKERYEHDLAQLERDIEKLSKKYVFVK